MANQKIEFEYNEHKYRALSNALKTESVASVLKKSLDRIYDKHVSAEQKRKVNERIETDIQKDELNTKAFSIIHLHTSDDDIFFTARNVNTLYDLINLYVNEEIGSLAAQNYSVDSLMLAFEDYSCVNEEVFNALSSALIDNDMISQEAHFEFDVNTLEFRNKEHSDMFGFDLNEMVDVFEKLNDDTKSECENEAEFIDCIEDLFDDCNEEFNLGM